MQKKKKEDQNFAVHKRLTSCIRQHIASLVAHSKEFVCKLGDLGLIPGLGTSPGAWQPTPDSCLENLHGQRSLVGYIQFKGLQRVGHY